MIGSHSQIDRNSILDFSGTLIIGQRVVISEAVIIYTHSHGHNPKSEARKTPLVIADDAWIGSRAIICEGVGRIGRGAIVAAGAVATKEVGDWKIVGGRRLASSATVRQAKRLLWRVNASNKTNSDLLGEPASQFFLKGTKHVRYRRPVCLSRAGLVRRLGAPRTHVASDASTRT